MRMPNVYVPLFTDVVYLVFKAPVHMVTNIESMINRDRPQMLHDGMGQMLTINWNHSYVYAHNSGGMCYAMYIICSLNNITLCYMSVSKSRYVMHVASEQ